MFYFGGGEVAQALRLILALAASVGVLTGVQLSTLADMRGGVAFEIDDRTHYIVFARNGDMLTCVQANTFLQWNAELEAGLHHGDCRDGSSVLLEYKALWRLPL